MMYISCMRRSKFSGVYSIIADTAGEKQHKRHYFVWELPGDAYAVQELDASFKPVSQAEFVDRRTFTQKFMYEPSLLAVPVVVPDLSFLEALSVRQSGEMPAQDTSAESRAKRSSSEPFASANEGTTELSSPRAKQQAAHRAYDLEAVRKAKVLESHMRETFRQTLLRLKRPRERKAAMLALEQIAGTTEGIVPAHKHMFRDFGVRLRQNFQPGLALLFNRKAVELAPEDDHARFNLARILCALGQYDEAAVQIRAAMDMDHEEPLYTKLLSHILAQQQKGLVPKPVRSK